MDRSTFRVGCDLSYEVFGPTAFISRVTAICNWIHDNVEYLRGSTNPLTSAYDTATERAGPLRPLAGIPGLLRASPASQCIWSAEKNRPGW